MKILRISTLALAIPATMLVTMLVALPAYAQATDTAAERARLANERIQLEAQRRAEEERRSREREALESESLESEDLESEDREFENRESLAPAQFADPAPTRADQQPRPRATPTASNNATAPSATPPPPADDDRISRALEQLRELGELRDAGYVTDEEFERIKTRILDSRF